MRRITFLLGMLPLMAFCGLRWVATGKPALPMLDAFTDWGTK